MAVPRRHSWGAPGSGTRQKPRQRHPSYPPAKLPLPRFPKSHPKPKSGVVTPSPSWGSVVARDRWRHAREAVVCHMLLPPSFTLNFSGKEKKIKRAKPHRQCTGRGAKQLHSAAGCGADTGEQGAPRCPGTQNHLAPREIRATDTSFSACTSFFCPVLFNSLP